MTDQFRNKIRAITDTVLPMVDEISNGAELSAEEGRALLELKISLKRLNILTDPHFEQFAKHNPAAIKNLF